jgi:CubicO group peptidase (beta-lactamase class C family)
MTLNTYLQKHIFEPLGIKDMSMIPNRDMRSRLAYMNFRDAEGRLRGRDHLLRLPLVVDPDDEEEVKRVFNSGGAGMFARVGDYCSMSSPFNFLWRAQGYICYENRLTDANLT